MRNRSFGQPRTPLVPTGFERLDAATLARGAEWLLRAAAAILVVVALLGIPSISATFVLEFFALSLAARLLGVPFEGATLELEAAAIFPAVLLSHAWEIGVVLAPAAVLLTRLPPRRGRLTLADADEAADLVLAYGASGYFFVSLGQSLQGLAPLALLFGGTILVFFFARVVLGAVHAAASSTTQTQALIRAAAFQFAALLLLSPIVAVIVLLQPLYGFLGALLGFLSVALVSASLRNLARARSRTEELARRNRELESLREIATLFATAASQTELFESLFANLSAAVPCQALAIVSYDEELDGSPATAFAGDVTLDRRSFGDWLASYREQDTAYRGTSAAPRAFSEDRALVLNPRLPWQVVLPLQTAELIAGLLVLESEDPSLVSEEVLQRLTALADHVALSLQDRSLKKQMQLVNERLQARAETLQRILEVSNELKSHLTLDLVLVNIVRAVHQSLGFGVVLLSLYDRTENVFERRAHVGLDTSWDELARQRLPREEIARWFSEKHRISKSYFVSHLDREGDDPTDRRRRRIRPSEGWNHDDLLFIPLTAGDQLVGVLQVDAPRSGLVPTIEDVQALEIFANQAVTAIQSARAYETTRQMSVRDSLTEAFNHRHFQETLYRELTRHERSGQPLALVMLDIDDFKKINDRWGHPVGDVVLKGLVEELLKTVREMDTVARYGGEEFAIIVPETTPEKALVVADRLRSRVASRLFVTPDISHPFSITISLGLACFPEDGTTKRVLIERADQALYQAKRNGKNCVVTAASSQEVL